MKRTPTLLLVACLALLALPAAVSPPSARSEIHPTTLAAGERFIVEYYYKVK